MRPKQKIRKRAILSLTYLTSREILVVVGFVEILGESVCGLGLAEKRPAKETYTKRPIQQELHERSVKELFSRSYTSRTGNSCS